MDAIRLLGTLLGNGGLSSGLGGKLLGSVLGGGGQQSGGGLGGLLGSVLGGGQQQQSSGGLLGSVLGGGSAPAAQQPAGQGVLGDLLGSVLGGGAAPQVEPAAHAAANQQAEIIIRAMINAAKSDGRIDDAEKKKIVEGLGAEVSQDEVAFVQNEFNQPLDAAAFAASVPREMAGQVYALSLTSIELDSQKEAEYLGQLAQGLGIAPAMANQIHDQMGAPKIFNA
jgi:uncharacterized membrane protein YebE (DUF533 family)